MNVQIFLFEVMDKEPSLAVIWSFFLVAAIGGFLLVRPTPFVLPVILLVVYVYSSLIISEINDPFVGPDIIREAGISYVIQSYVAIAIGLFGPMLGVFGWFHRRKKRARQFT